LHIQVIVPGLQELIKNHDRQLEILTSSIEATTTALRREIDDVRHSVESVHRDVETLKSKCEWQTKAFDESMGTVEGKIADSLSPVTSRLSVCEDNLKRMQSKHRIQIKTLRGSIGAVEEKIADSLSPVTSRLSVCEDNLKRMQSKHRIQIKTLRGSIRAVEEKITDSLSPVTSRLSVCEEQLKSHSPVSTPSPTPNPASTPTPVSVPIPSDSRPAAKRTKKSWFSWGKPRASPSPAPTSVSLKFDDRADKSLKFVVLGDAGVDKTTIIMQFVGQESSNQLTTIEAGCFVKEIDVNGHKAVLRIFDTSGKPEYRAILTPYLRNADGILLAYDVTSCTGFGSLGGWIELIRDNILLPIPIVLIGHMPNCDEVREVSSENGKIFRRLLLSALW
jgi:archaellum component FlaC